MKKDKVILKLFIMAFAGIAVLVIIGVVGSMYVK
jgi:hypothetical protein